MLKKALLIAFVGTVCCLSNSVSALNITVDGTTEYETQYGFGTCIAWWVNDPYNQNYFRERYAQDAGCSMLRVELMPDVVGSPSCQSSCPYLGTDIQANIEQLDFSVQGVGNAGQLAQALDALKLDEFRLIGALWTPPHNLKSGDKYCGPYGESCCGYLTKTSSNYTQFGRYVAAWVKGFQQTYGVPFYALSIQNEPYFCQGFNSCVYDNTGIGSAADYPPALKAVADEFEANGITTKLIGPEDLKAGDDDHGVLWRHMQYIEDIRADSEAFAALDGFAVHGYAGDGATSGGSSPEGWNMYWNGGDLGWDSWEGIKNDGKELNWQTEVSGDAVSWDGAMVVATMIHEALVIGHCNGWLYWQMADDGSVGQYTLTGSDMDTSEPKYCAFKHFSRYIRPGAVRVDASPADSNNLLTSAYVHDGQDTVTIVMVNKSSSSRTADITLSSMPSVSSFDGYRSSGSERWLSVGPYNVSGNTVSVSLPAESIVTLYGSSTGGGDTTPPDAPTGLTATAVSSSQIDLDWDDNTEGDLDSYRVYRGGSQIASGITSSSYSDTGLSASTQYCYTVTAVDSSNNESAESNQDCATTQSGGGEWGPYSAELLSNPSFESGTNGWTKSGAGSGSLSAVSSDHDISSAQHGSQFILHTLATDGSSGCYQEVDISSWADEIDAGDAQILCQGWLQAAEHIWDDTRLRVMFYDSGSSLIETAYDSNWITDGPDSWTQYGVSDYAIPSGARTVRIWAQFVEVDWDAGGFDNATCKVRTRSGGGDTTPPAAPTDLTATAVSSSQIDLDWDDNSESDLDSYNVYRGGSQIASGVASSSYSDTGLSPETQYCYTVTAVDTSSNESLESAQDCATTESGPDTTPPAAPTGLTATAVSSSQIDLDWDDNSEGDLDSYRVYRGGSQVATVYGASSYSDTGLSPETQYCYTVTAVDTSNNESAESNQDCATTQSAGGGLPSPWQNADVGSPTTGNASYDSGTFTIEGNGNDIWNTSDNFHYVYQSLSGDGEIEARVASLENTNSWAKAGVMVRESLTGGSKHAMMVVTPGNGTAFQRRTSTGGSSSHTAGSSVNAPYWVRLVRSGDTFTGYESGNGSSWSEVGSATVSMATDVYIGLPVTSHSNGVLCTAVIDNVTVTAGGGDTTPPAAPTGLAATAVSSSQIDLDWDDNTEGDLASYNVYRGGSQIASGVASSSYSDTGLSPETQYCYTVTAVDTSSNESSESTQDCTTTQSTGLPSPWQSQDVGSPDITGSASYDSGTFTVEGDGSDISGTSDAFHYVYQSCSGDAEIIARVVSLGPITQDWAKAGVMFRESLTADSPYALGNYTTNVADSVHSWTILHRDTTGGGSTQTVWGTDQVTPYWLRVVRSGNDFSCYVSSNGSSWTLVDTVTISMATDIYVGLAVTSHDAGNLTTGVLANVSVTP